jgi:hypothetical protein
LAELKYFLFNGNLFYASLQLSQDVLPDFKHAAPRHVERIEFLTIKIPAHEKLKTRTILKRFQIHKRFHFGFFG